MMDYCDKVYDTAPLETVMSLINGFAFKSSTYLSNGAYRVITIKTSKMVKLIPEAHHLSILFRLK